MKQRKMMSIIFLETLNIEWGQIDPKDNRRVKKEKIIQRIRLISSELHCDEIKYYN